MCSAKTSFLVMFRFSSLDFSFSQSIDHLCFCSFLRSSSFQNMKSLEFVRIKPTRHRFDVLQRRTFTKSPRVQRLPTPTSSRRPQPQQCQLRTNLLQKSPLIQYPARFNHDDSRPTRRQGARRSEKTAPVVIEEEHENEKDLEELYGEEPTFFADPRVPGRPVGPSPFDDTMLEEAERLVLRKAKKQKPTPFVPETFTPETLITNRIATASSTTLGYQATVQAALARLSRRDDTSFGYDDALARKVAHGGLVRFKDEDEKRRILALAEEHAMDTTAKRNRDKLRKITDGNGFVFETPRPIEFAPVPDKNRKGIVDKVLRGQYEYEGKVKGTSKEDPTSNLKKSIDLNGTYSDSAEGGFLGLFRKLLPQLSKR
jgi:hypothetical protein